MASIVTADIAISIDGYGARSTTHVTQLTYRPVR